MTELVKVGATSEFSENDVTSFDVEGIELMGVKIDGKYIVSSRICTHKYYDLTKGHYAEGYVTCLLHTAVFELENGEALNPPATEALQTYKTQVIDDEVFIDIDQ